MAGVLEGLSAEKTISAFYIAYFGRAADPQGFAYWLGDFARGQSLDQIANNFAPQGETSEEYPFLVNDANGDGTFETAPVSNTAFFRAGLRDVISDIYVNLFGREPNAAELAAGGGVDYWVDEILVRGRPLGEIAIRIANGASATDAAVLLNKIEVAESFTLAASAAGIGDQSSEVTAEFKAASAAIVAGVDETEASVTAAEAQIDAFIAGGTPGASFTLTDAVGENFPGTAANDTFNVVIGTDATINNFDSVNGGAGNDTLNVIVDGAFAVPASASITGVENINLAIEAGSTGTIDAGEFVGSTTFRQAGALALDITGLTNQTVVYTDDIGNVEYDEDATAATVVLEGVNDGETLNVDGVDLTSLTISGSIEDDGAGGPGTLTISSTVEDTTTTANDGSNIETVTVSLTSDAIINADALFGSEDFTTLDASASTGDIEFSTDNGGDNSIDTVLTGTGDDTVYFDQDYSGQGDGGVEVTINVGAGDDEVSYAAYGNTDAVSATITLGADNDTFALVESFDNVVDASEDNFADSLITVADFNVDEDVFDISDLGLTLGSLTNVESSGILDADNLFDAIELAADALDTVGGETAVLFQYGSDAYLLASVDNDFTDGDGLVKLTGVSVDDLGASNLVA